MRWGACLGVNAHAGHMVHNHAADNNLVERVPRLRRPQQALNTCHMASHAREGEALRCCRFVQLGKRAGPPRPVLASHGLARSATLDKSDI